MSKRRQATHRAFAPHLAGWGALVAACTSAPVVPPNGDTDVGAGDTAVGDPAAGDADLGCPNGFIDLLGDGTCVAIAHPECPFLPADASITRAPIPWEWAPFNHFPQWHADPAAFESGLLTELTQHRQHIIGGFGFGGHVLTPWGWGAVRGVADPIYGDWATPRTGEVLDLGLPTRGELEQRYSDVAEFTAAFEGLTRVMPYVELSTQVFGHHLQRTGFFDFYDHWEDYEGVLGLAEKPPEPTTWLRRFYNDDSNPYGLPPSEFPSELNGFAFSYSPVKCQYDSAACYVQRQCDTVPVSTVCASTHYRYAADIASDGWLVHWREIFRGLARVGFDGAFIDNTYYSGCWNAACQSGFSAWLDATYGAELAERVFTRTTSRYFDHGFEGNWFQDPNGAWRTDYAYAEAGTLSPSIDSLYGAYAARLDGPGRLALYTTTGLATAGLQHKLTVHYRTQGDAQASFTVDQIGAPITQSLPAASEWTAVALRFLIPGSDVRVVFDSAGDGDLFIDETWLSEVVGSGVDETFPFPTFSRTLAEAEELWSFPGRARALASARYWDGLVDEKLPVLRDTARTIAPGFELFTNSYRPRRGADYFMIEGQAVEFENQRQDTGYAPGVYPPGDCGGAPCTLRALPITSDVLVTNIFDYRLSGAQRFTDFFGYTMHSAVRPAIEQAHNPSTALLQHAEAAAFGGGAGVDLGLRSTYWYYDATETAALRAVADDFFAFVDAHAELFTCLEPHADVAVVFHDLASAAAQHEAFELFHALLADGVLTDLLDARVTPERLLPYRAVVYHAIPRLSEAEAEALTTYVNAGGVVLLSGEVGRLDDLDRLRAANPASAWPPPQLDLAASGSVVLGDGVFVVEPDGVGPSEVLSLLEGGLGETLGTLSGVSAAARARLRVVAWRAYDRVVVHLVNYDAPVGKANAALATTLTDVGLRVPLPPGWTPSSAELLSPEAGAASLPFEIVSGHLQATVPTLHVYGAVLLRR